MANNFTFDFTDYNVRDSIRLFKRVFFKEDVTHIGSTVYHKILDKCRACTDCEQYCYDDYLGASYCHCSENCECPPVFTVAFGCINVFIKGRPVITTPENSAYIVQIIFGQCLEDAMSDAIENAEIAHEFCIQQTLDEEKSDYKKLITEHVLDANNLHYFDESMNRFSG